MPQIRRHEARRAHLAHAVGRDLGEVFFEHEPMGGQVRGVHRVERGVQSGGVGNHGLPAPARRPRGLEARGTAVFEQACARAARVLRREGGEAEQDGVAQARAEFAAPPGGRARARRDERVGYRLGRDEGVGHDAAEQVVLPPDAERPRRFDPDERVARHEIDRAGAVGRRVVLPREREALERREPFGDPGAGRPFVALREAAPVRRVHDHDSARRAGQRRAGSLRRFHERRGSRTIPCVHRRATMDR